MGSRATPPKLRAGPAAMPWGSPQQYALWPWRGLQAEGVEAGETECGEHPEFLYAGWTPRTLFQGPSEVGASVTVCRDSGPWGGLERDPAARHSPPLLRLPVGVEQHQPPLPVMTHGRARGDHVHEFTEGT